MPSLNELIEKIEAAGEGSRELDAGIFSALGWSPVPNPHNAMGLLNRWQREGAMTGHEGPPMYSTSLDAAQRLLPDLLPGQGGWRVECHTDLVRKFHADVWVHLHAEPGDRWFKGSSKATAALALCAAALKARAQTQEPEYSGWVEVVDEGESVIAKIAPDLASGRTESQRDE